MSDGAWLAAIVDASDDAIIGKTLEGVVVSWNPGATRLYGYTAAEMVGRPISTLVPPERLDEVPSILLRIARGQRVDRFETVRVRQDGTRADVSVTVSPVRDARGRVVGCSTIARDVTDRQLADRVVASSERRFAALFRASPALLLLCTVEGRVLDASHSVLEMLGMRREELVGALLDVVDLLWPAGGPADLVDRLARDGRVSNVPVRVRTRAGEVRDVVLSAALVTAGTERLVIGAATDVTPLRAAENRLEASLRWVRRLSSDRERLIHRLVEAQERECRRIAAGMHDDTMQVLGAVSFGLHRLRARVAPGTRELVDELSETVQLAMTRLRGMLFELHPGVLEREGLVAAVRASLDALGGDTGMATQLSASMRREPSLERSTALYRIIQEALANIRKHSGAGFVEVTLAEEDGVQLVAVRDDGAGFSPGDRVRPDSLGLISMRERAEMLGGRLEVETAPGLGVTVRVRAPVEAP